MEFEVPASETVIERIAPSKLEVGDLLVFKGQTEATVVLRTVEQVVRQRTGRQVTYNVLVDGGTAWAHPGAIPIYRVVK